MKIAYPNERTKSRKSKGTNPVVFLPWFAFNDMLANHITNETKTSCRDHLHLKPILSKCTRQNVCKTTISQLMGAIRCRNFCKDSDFKRVAILALFKMRRLCKYQDSSCIILLVIFNNLIRF